MFDFSTKLKITRSFAGEVTHVYMISNKKVQLRLVVSQPAVFDNFIPSAAESYLRKAEKSAMSKTSMQ